MVYKVEALAREADPKPWEFEFDDETYQLPSSLDMRVIAALEGGRLDAALRMLLGAEQWERMQASSAVFNTDALEGLMRAYMDDLGVDLGKR